MRNSFLFKTPFVHKDIIIDSKLIIGNGFYVKSFQIALY